MSCMNKRLGLFFLLFSLLFSLPAGAAIPIDPPEEESEGLFDRDMMARNYGERGIQVTESSLLYIDGVPMLASGELAEKIYIYDARYQESVEFTEVAESEYAVTVLPGLYIVYTINAEGRMIFLQDYVNVIALRELNLEDEADDPELRLDIMLI